jgi:hypothetical protein
VVVPTAPAELTTVGEPELPLPLAPPPPPLAPEADVDAGAEPDADDELPDDDEDDEPVLFAPFTTRTAMLRFGKLKLKVPFELDVIVETVVLTASGRPGALCDPSSSAVRTVKVAEAELLPRPANDTLKGTSAVAL